MKKIVVISLGGSLIVPNKINIDFLKEFKKTLFRLSKKYKLIIVCGGGSTARIYIGGLAKEKISPHLQGLIGIASTRFNARFMNYFFSFDSEKGIPHKIRDLKKILRKKDFVFCGALTYKTGATTDTQAAEIAKEFKTDLINLTNVNGLYDKDPNKYKNAKLTRSISWQNFNKMASKIKFEPGQHFVLDQKAAKIILENKIKTYILGKNLKELEKAINGKKFIGTTISD